MANWEDMLEGKQLLEELAKRYKAEEKAEAELLALQLTNAQRLADLRITQINKEKTYKLQKEQEVNEKLIKMGLNVQAIIDKDYIKNKVALLEQEYAKKIKEANKANKKILKDELAEKKKEVEAEIKEIEKQRKDLEKKQDKQVSKQLISGAQNNMAGIIGSQPFNFRAMQEALDSFAEDIKDKTGKDVGVVDQTRLLFASLTQSLSNYTRQFSEQIKDIAYAQSEIDTRLQGSNLNTRWYGSYWKTMNQDVVRFVGMSPFVKQADIINNLKTLVSKGISFDVEQRAFLQTISDKIATTFEATDSTLLKLVRIQQADTTAARLGMESALTAFLNSMYETTEYMTDAATSIRANLYGASALMGAAEGTAFEYQVQKWMGSLYSVGFSNTEGLSAALGKLAAGDISAINNGGYGNLLLMAANRANLSIADILADGLDDSETNLLLQNVVEYLGEIYAETKNSKVVAQQFANIYGLTASDLKAAANLYGSTNVIGKNNLGYTGMLARLQDMTNSMYSRMGTGEMMANLMDNFKFATSSSIGNSPILYSIFTLGNMLKDTTGGIDVPLPLVMGNGLNAKLNIADLMLAGSLSFGFLEGLGTMISGLATGNGIGTGALLKNFGITDNRLTTLTRGTGTGIAAIAGRTVSESGSFAGNANGSDIQNKTLTDATDEGNEKVEAAQDEYNDTKLSTVDEHVLQIYTLLQGVVDGTDSLHVEVNNVSAWADIMNGGRI